MAERLRNNSPRRFSPYPRRQRESDSSSLLSTSGCSREIFTSPDASSYRDAHHSDSDIDERLVAADVTDARPSHGLELDGDQNIPVEETFLSLVLLGGKFGAASFDATSLQLKLFTDVTREGGWSCLEGVLHQIKPSVVIFSSKEDSSLIGLLKEQHLTMDMLPSLDYGIDASRRRLLTLTTLPGLRADMTEEERMIYMTSLIPMDCINMIRAAGALIKYLDRKRIGVELDDPSIPVPILSIKVCSMDSMMLVDNDSFRALQIFRPEVHPSVYKAGKYKEGLSLFGIMNRTRTSIGAKRLRSWFLRPLRDMATLTERQSAVEFMVQPRNEEVVQDLLSCLKHVKAMPRILAKMRTASASVADWQALYKTAYNALKIGDVCRQLPGHVLVFSKIAKAFTNSLYEIASLVNRVVDFRQSVDQSRFIVKRGVDPQLDEKKNTYHGLPDFMTVVAEQELTQLDPSISECSVIYLPQLGYLLSIPVGSDAKEDDNFDLDGLEFMFLSNRTAHYKSQSTRELDALLGDTQCEIIDHETSIMHQLQAVILQHSKTLLDVMEYSADLDCLLSLALSSREFNFSKPELTLDNVLRITGGRHPLQELCVTQFVANDTDFQVDKDRIKVLTGPNASGKSVYLKQVGLIVFLAHIGSFVPAESAVVGLRDRLFTRISALETVSVNLSTFMLDINQIAAAVQSSSAMSLILIDEFGKGTATMDGVSLFCAILRHWMAQGSSCPMILSSTHFHSVLRRGFLPPSPLLQFQMMDTMMDGEEVVFLHQLVDGITGKSHALHVATTAGLPAEVVQRSLQVSALLNAGKPVPPLNSRQSEAEFSRLSSIVDEFLGLDLEGSDVAGFIRQIASPDV